jgi:hypothetical protein
MSAYRLGYIAKKLNKTTSQIVEILALKGIFINNENKSKLSKEHIDILTKELAINFFEKNKKKYRSLNSYSTDFSKIVDYSCDCVDFEELERLHGNVKFFKSLEAHVQDNLDYFQLHLCSLITIIKSYIKSSKLKKFFIDQKARISSLITLYLFYIFTDESDENRESVFTNKLLYSQI